MFLDRSTDGFVNIEALLSPHLWYNKISRLFIFVVCVFYVFALNLYCICIFSQINWWMVLPKLRHRSASSLRGKVKFLCCLVLSLYLCCNSNCICVLILLYLCNYIYCTFIILLLYLYFISAFSRMEKWNSFSYS